MNKWLCALTLAPFGYDNSVSLQTDDAGHVGAAVLVHVACIVGLQTNDVFHNWKGLLFWTCFHDTETFSEVAQRSELVMIFFDDQRHGLLNES